MLPAERRKPKPRAPDLGNTSVGKRSASGLHINRIFAQEASRRGETDIPWREPVRAVILAQGQTRAVAVGPVAFLRGDFHDSIGKGQVGRDN